MSSMDRPARSMTLGTNLLKHVYMDSVSTIYGVDAPGHDADDSDDYITTKRKKSSAPLLHTTEAHDLKKELRYFFMNTIQKWRARRRFPWKLLFQIIKLLLVTTELVLYTEDNIYRREYHTDTTFTCNHLFLKGWDTTDEVLSYPPPAGPMAVYKQSEFFQYLDFAIVNFAKIDDISLASYYNKMNQHNVTLPASFCTTEFNCYWDCSDEDQLRFNATTTTNCLDIWPKDVKKKNFSLRAFAAERDFNINFRLLSKATLNFQFKAFRLRFMMPNHRPDCHNINTTLVFDNVIGGSQMLVNLDVQFHLAKCHGDLQLVLSRKTTKVMYGILDCVSIIICLVSTVLCARSLQKGRVLKKKTNKFFEANIGRPLSRKEKWEFLNLWYVLICIDDIILLTGLYLRLGLETGTYRKYGDVWSVCAVCLGVGNLLGFVGILRYLGFFSAYNIMILTMKKCAPNVLRLSVCILLIFFGYVFAGWLILGPYHFKFQTFMSSMECLYSLINGDDMFATFFSTHGLDPVIWYFSRVYLYSFISLFMWVVLSIFLAVIMDAYETIKIYYIEGFPRTGLMKFVSECRDRDVVTRGTSGRERTIHDTINSLCCCVQRKHRKARHYQSI